MQGRRMCTDHEPTDVAHRAVDEKDETGENRQSDEGENSAESDP